MLGGSDGWIVDLYKLKALKEYADDPSFQEEWRGVKTLAKERAASLILRLTGIKV